ASSTADRPRRHGVAEVGRRQNFSVPEQKLSDPVSLRCSVSPWFICISGFDRVARMYLGRVIGTVVATRKSEGLEGAKLLVVQPLDERGAPAGDSFLAVDMVQAGAGDVVLVNREGNGNRQLLGMGAQVPIRSLIVGIVDQAG